jgi:hypothetical protein
MVIVRLKFRIVQANGERGSDIECRYGMLKRVAGTALESDVAGDPLDLAARCGSNGRQYQRSDPSRVCLRVGQAEGAPPGHAEDGPPIDPVILTQLLDVGDEMSGGIRAEIGVRLTGQGPTAPASPLVEQHGTVGGRARRMLGAFQFNIPVATDPDILPSAIRELSILRYIQLTIPSDNRWHPTFTRWLNGLAAKVAGLGGDPNQVLPSPTGGDHPLPPPCPEPEPCKTGPRDFWCMSIPWSECEVEGEIDLKLRFRKKGKE